MQSRILKNTMLSCIIVVILTVFTCVFAFSSSLQETMNQQAYSQTMLLVHILENTKEDPFAAIEKIKGEIYGRITLVDLAGKVVYDSDYDEAVMDNHSDREEIINAMERGVAMQQRYSATTGRITYYCAAKVENIGVIRLGVMSANLATDTVVSTSPVIWAFAGMFIVLSLFFSAVTTSRIVNTIENYDLDKGEGEIYPELSHFVTRIKSQNDVIRQQVRTLTGEKRKLQSIFMNIREGIIVCDNKKRIVQTNKEARNIFGLTDEDSSFARAVPVQELQRAVDAASEGQVSHSMFELAGRWYQCVTSPHVYGGDNGAILVVLDVTQQVENENNRRKFTDNVTHELKTPLTSIIGYSQLITNDIARPDDIKGFVQIIEKNAETLMDMINDIIRISNLETGGDFHKSTLQLDKIVSSVIAQEKLSAQTRNITINEQLAPVQINADEGQMYQLAHNLISNAIKYNRDNGSVDIKLYKEGNTAVFEVKDTGIGIPKEHQDKIFERFYVVDKSRNKKISSTGLGLSIVKHVVIAHDGNISVDSQPGLGTQFVVKLPIE